MAMLKDSDKRLKRLEECSVLEKKRKEYIFGENSRLKPVRLDDLCGMPQIIDEIQRVISFLRNYQRFKEVGARIQPGMLLYGRPGTGKTLTARIITTESGAKLIDAGNFPKQGKSMTAGDIAPLFTLAKEYYIHAKKPIIIYFDEIDVVCSSENDDDTYYSKRKHSTDTCAALLSELDGMSGKPEGVFVIAVTNSDPDRLDGALLRAGRLGHHIYYKPPTSSGRLEILRYYLEKKHADRINVEGIAKAMPESMTPAEIEELVEQAYMNAHFGSTNPKEAKLTDEYLIKQLLKDILGPPTETWATESDRYHACVHEAGHAITVSRLGCLVKLVVVPKNGYSQGHTLFDSQHEEPSTNKDVEKDIIIIYGGEVAEELIFGKWLLGNDDDVGKATKLSINLVVNWDKTTNYIDGNPCLYGENSLIHPLHDSERLSIYTKSRHIRDRCYRQAKKVLKKFGKKRIEYVAKCIFEREFLLGNDLWQVLLEAGKRYDTYMDEKNASYDIDLDGRIVDISLEDQGEKV